MHRSVLLSARVAILGASGSIGQPLAMELKKNPLVQELRLYDRVKAKGVAEDLSHMPTPGTVYGYGPGQIQWALKGATIVVVAAGFARSPGMTRDDLFNTNALVVKELMEEVALHSPTAVVGLFTNPLNSMIAVAAETLRQEGVYNPQKLIGLSVLDLDRARTFLAEVTQRKSYELRVPIVGGHSGTTLVPLFSNTGLEITQEQAEYITHRLRSAGDEVVRAKQGGGSSSLSVAYAASEWVFRVARALNGEKGITDYSIIDSPLQAPKCRFFCSPFVLGVEGVETVLPMPPMNAYEETLLDRCLPDLEKNIKKGLDYCH